MNKKTLLMPTFSATFVLILLIVGLAGNSGAQIARPQTGQNQRNARLVVKPQLIRIERSVFAMTFLLDFMYAKHYGFKNADFSEEYLNYVSNLAIAQQIDGGFFDQL